MTRRDILPTLSLNGYLKSTGEDDSLLCPICSKYSIREEKFKLYAQPVCKRCQGKFAFMRLVAGFIDVYAISMLYCLLGWLAIITLPTHTTTTSNAGITTTITGIGPIFELIIGLVVAVMLSFKDGFRGCSLGKRICGVQVVNVDTLAPIGFSASFVRNLPPVGLLLLVVCGRLILSPSNRMLGLIMIVGLLIIAYKLEQGPRWGDSLAKTKVIWTKYRHRVPFDCRGLLCTGCGYNLMGNESGICPECGQPIKSTPQKQK